MEFILKIKLFSRDGKDQGANVRERAKQLVALLKDDERLRAEREKSLKNKERFSKTTTGIGSTGGSVTGYGSGGGLSGATAVRIVLMLCTLYINI